MDTPSGSPMRKIVAPVWAEYVPVDTNTASSILQKALVLFAKHNGLESNLGITTTKLAPVFLADPDTLECAPLRFGQLVVLAAFYGFKIDSFLVCEHVTLDEATFVMPPSTDELGVRQRLLARLFPEYVQVCLHKNKFYFRSTLPLFVLLAIMYMHSCKTVDGIDWAAYHFRPKRFLVPNEYLSYKKGFAPLENAMLVDPENLQPVFDTLLGNLYNAHPDVDEVIDAHYARFEMQPDKITGLQTLFLYCLYGMPHVFSGRFAQLNDGAVNLLLSACYFSGSYCGFRQRVLARVFPEYFCVSEESNEFSFAREMPIDVFANACSLFGVCFAEKEDILQWNLMVKI
jgi:hypothetical protein